MNSTLKKTLSLIAALSFYGLLIFVVIILYPGRNDFNLGAMFTGGYPKMIFSGFLYTILISLIALIGSIILGFTLYLLTVSKVDTFRYIATIYNETVFGTPLIVFIVVAYYMIWKYLPFDSRLWGGIVALVFYMGPYMKNLFEGAMKTIDPLQYQAMTVYIIIPQLIRVIIPSLIANLTIIIKGSSLLNFIGVPELYNQLLFVQYDNFLVMEGYLLMFITYL